MKWKEDGGFLISKIENVRLYIHYTNTKPTLEIYSHIFDNPVLSYHSSVEEAKKAAQNYMYKKALKILKEVAQ